MESAYLRALSVFLKKFRHILIYGAGGVTADLLAFVGPYLPEHTCIVVTQKTEGREEMGGYPVKELAEFSSACQEAYVLVSAAPRHVPQMEAQLNRLGFTNYCRASKLVEEMCREIEAFPVDRYKIVFSNGDGYGFGGNPKYIALELRKRRPDLDLVWAIGEGGGGLPQGVRAVPYGTYAHYYELGTAGFWLDNQHKNFFTRKRKGQYYLQTWHGGGPLKKIEFDAKGLPDSYLDLCERNAKMTDVMVSPSAFNSRLYRQAFHYRGEILECGYPRNDLFWKDGGCGSRVRQLFGLRPEEGILLFAPTYKASETEKGDLLDLFGVQRALELRWGKPFRIFIRFHPFDREPGKGYVWHKAWMNVTAYEDVQELLAAADILITDYSSVMWDFSLQKKPVFLFHPDLDRYEKERGYYLPFGRMPYREAFSNGALCQEIAAFDEGVYQAEVSAFLADYGSFDRGTASRAVADWILVRMDGEEGNHE